ncbi:MAG: MBL fold metallo-hydrolase [bacterium]
MKTSSVIIPYRRRHELEVFWTLRQPHLKFLGGFYAFFGGSVEAVDTRIPVRGGQGDHVSLACAAREFLEESGIWVGTHGVRWSEHLRALSPEAFLEDLTKRDEAVDGAFFHAVGQWITPDFAAIRHTSWFYTVDLTELEDSDRLAASLQSEELAQGEWLTPAAALEKWRSERALVSQPVRAVLEALVQGDGRFVLDGREPTRPRNDAEAAPGLRIVPLRTPTLPPATHTNCIIVGDTRCVVIDPGSDRPDELERLFAVIDDHLREGAELAAIVLTHHHPDHVLGVDAVRSRYHVGVWAHPRTAHHLGVSVERELHDGDRIDLGPDSLDVLLTPGHADGHLAFVHERSGVVIVGDLVAQVGTILVDPIDGHMGDYLDSLATIQALAPQAILPSHGWIIAAPEGLLTHYIEHRMAREALVLEALRTRTKATADELTPLAYPEVPSEIWPIASRSVLAHLIHLVETGHALRTKDVFEVRV